MLTLLKRAFDYFTVSDSEVEIEQNKFDPKDLISNIDCKNKSLNADNENSPSGNEPALQDSLCQLRVGTVTDLFSNYGLIDGEVYFDTSSNLNIGDRVEFLAFRLRVTDDWRVKKIYSIQDEMWEAVERKAENKETLFKRVVTQVSKRCARSVITDKVEFSLDTVAADFIPLEGDWILLDVIVEVDGQEHNFEGAVLHVEGVHPLRSRVLEGNVTHWNEKSGGLIDNSIFFAKSFCEPGYIPNVHDKVAVEAIESSFGSVSWRALRVAPLISQNNQPNYVGMNKNSSLNKRYGITVEPELLKSGHIKIKEEKELSFVLKNVGKTNQVLKYCKFLGPLSQSQIRLKNPLIQKEMDVHPGQSVVFNFLCNGRFKGTHFETLCLVFIGFEVNVPIEVTVDMLEHKVSRRNAAHAHGEKLIGSIKREQNAFQKMVILGEKPVKPSPFAPVRIGQYCVPNYLWTKVLYMETSLKNKEEKQVYFSTVYPSFAEPVTFENYTRRFHGLLYLEEISVILKMREYDLRNVIFRIVGGSGEFFALEVPGLAERRPSLIVGDKVLASKCTCNDNTEYEGYIHQVNKNEIWLKFNSNFHIHYNDEEYNVKFCISRNAYRRCHAAVDMAHKNLGVPILFPTFIKLKQPQLDLFDVNVDTNDIKQINMETCDSGQLSVNDMCNSNDSVATYVLQNEVCRNVNNNRGLQERKIIWFNKNLNFIQKKAVRSILKGQARPLPYIIFGPPGTGKTVTLIEVILQIFNLLPDSRIVVATPSNSSANLIVERLIKTQFINSGDMVRLTGIRYIEEGGMPDHIMPYSITIDEKNMNILGRHRITVGTCVTLGHLHTCGLPKGHFTHVLIDEAGQALEPEIFIPISSCLARNCGQIVLAGDPQQLGPVTMSAIATEFGLGESYITRLLQCQPYQRDPFGFSTNSGYNPQLVTKLLFNYRSLPDILKLSSEMFYDSELIPKISEEDSVDAELLSKLSSILPKCEKTPAIMFHGVIGGNYQDEDCPSWYNPEEAVIVTSYLQKLYQLNMNPEDIGIITPYQRQVQKLRDLLNCMESVTPKIGSVEEFQGQERPVIILSAVRSSAAHVGQDIRHALGFISSPNRLNVALTRARSLLIIVGNPQLLSIDPYWRSVFNYCLNLGSYVGCEIPSLPQSGGIPVE